jgi:PDZ domain-containing protein
VLAALSVVGPAGLVVASGVTDDAFAITPGEANPTGPRISVANAQSYDSDGEVLFVTVGVPRLNALSREIAEREPEDEIVPARAILGDRTPSQNRKENIALMGYSKDFASYVALTKLGYEVKLSGGGAVVESLCMATSDDGTSCTAESPAAKALRKDDVITAVAGQPVHLPSDITPILAGRQPGDVVTITVKRHGEPAPLDLDVELTRTSEPGSTRTIVGFIPNEAPPADLTFAFPVEVGIDSGQVSGPSAGLAFTLALLDKLTPGELTGGKAVAATGTMTPSGRVGNIGGVRQKTIAVARAGADVFLVPFDEEAEAIEGAKGTDLKVVGVRDIDDALAQLRLLGGNVDELTARRTS